MTVSSGDYLRVSCNFQLGDGTLYQNIWHYTRDGPDPYSDAAHVTAIKARIDAIYATIDDYVKNDVIEQLSFVDKITWDGTKWKVTENIGTFTPAWVPTPVGESLPFQVSPFVVFKTTRPKTVGRKFLFPFTEAMQADSILVAAALTACAAYGAAGLLDAVLGGANVLIPGVVRTGIEQWLSFQVAVANDIVGSQKRRRPGVGA